MLGLGLSNIHAQDDILDAIEAELKAEEEKKKAAAKAAKNEAKYKANYEASVRKGDALMRSKKYDDAIEAFEDAKKWGPLEKYPEEQIKVAKEEKVKQEAAEKQAQIEAEYKAAVKVADDLFNAKKYKESIPGYEKAKGIDPSMAYPADQIAEAKKLQAKLEEEQKKAEEAKKLEEDYQAALESGDDALKKEAYDEAIGFYEKAKALKPTEQVPKARIETAKKTKADAEAKAAQEKLQQEFDAAMDKANELLSNQSYDEAIAAYKEAQKIIPSNSTPKEKITEAETLKKQAAQLATKAKYDELVNAADNLLNDSQFDAAKEKYAAASAVLPHETYPKTKIKECEELKVAAAQAELKSRYDALVKEADGMLEKEEFDAAKQKYEEALKLMPHETHPKTMIAEADNRKIQKAKQATKDEYDAVLKEADALAEAEKFDEAIAKYNEAKKILPNETHPGDMVIEMEKRKQQKAHAAVEAEYETALKAAEELMHAEKFDEAIAGFEAAHKILPTENKTTELIAEAKKLKADKQHAATQSEFDAKIKEGEDLLNEKKFDEAITAFNAAAEILPTDNKPKFLIEETQKQKKQHEEELATEKYNELVKAGDVALEQNDFVEARLKYNEALAVHKAGKNEIDKKLALLKQKEKEKLDAEMAEAQAEEKQKKFDELIAAANSETGTGNYSGAMVKLNQALGLFPDNSEALALKSEIETRIKEKEEQDAAKAEAERLANEKAAKESQIESLISEAKSQADQKNFSAALASIEKASAIDASNAAVASAKTEIETAKAAFEKEKQENAAAAALAEKEKQEREAKIKTLLSEGNAAFAEKNYQIAEGKFNEVINIAPDNAVAKQKLSEISSAKESERLAEEAAAKAEADKKRAEEIKQQVAELLTQGNNQLAEEDFDNAISSFQQAAGLAPNNAEVSSKLRLAQTKKAEKEQAVAAEAKAKADALAKAQAAEEKAKREAQIQALTEAASSLELQSNFEGAKSKYQEILAIDNSNSMASAKIAAMDEKIKKLNAEKLAKEAAEKAEKDRLAAAAAEKERKQKIASQLGIGDQMMQNRNFNAALDAYEEALALDAENKLVQSKIAEAQNQIKLEEDKRAKMNELEKQAEIERLITEAQGLVVRREYLSAKSKYDQVLSLEANNGAATNGLKAIESNLKEIEEAEARAAAKLAAEQELARKIETILDEGYDLFAGGKYEEAIAEFRKGVDLDPTNQEVKQGIHDALEQQTRLKMIMLAKKSNRPRPQPKFVTEQIGSSNERTDKAKYQNELGKAYPEGVTESTEQKDRKKITKRIVVKEQVGSEYKQIKYDWGGTYYFKNGESVGPYIWQYETRDPTKAN